MRMIILLCILSVSDRVDETEILYQNCIRLNQWDKIGTKLGQCVFCAIVERWLTFSIGCSRYKFNLSMEAPKDVMGCFGFMEGME